MWLINVILMDYFYLQLYIYFKSSHYLVLFQKKILNYCQFSPSYQIKLERDGILKSMAYWLYSSCRQSHFKRTWKLTWQMSLLWNLPMDYPYIHHTVQWCVHNHTCVQAVLPTIHTAAKLSLFSHIPFHFSSILQECYLYKSRLC